MKCFRYFSFALFALLGVFFGSFIINQNDTYAVSDLTFTFDGSNVPTSWVYLCSNSGIGGASSCDSYKYLYVSFSGNFISRDFRAQYYITQSGAGNSWPLVPYFLSSALLSLYSPADVRFNFANIQYAPSTDWSCTVTLSENNPFGSSSSGSLSITENGTYDVTNYAEAVVDVPTSSGGGGNYHEDLVAINNSIMICAATCLVIYFFYCIYRMIIKNSGVK